MTHTTPEDATFTAAAGEVFAEMVRVRLNAQGLHAEVSTEQYAKHSDQDRAVWAVCISTTDESCNLVCEVAEGDAFVSLMDDSGAEGYTQSEALAYIAGRVAGRTRIQARTAPQTASPRRSYRTDAGSRTQEDGRRVTGVVLLAVGCGLLIANRAAAILFPSWWGGPNIGGGFINLLAVPLAIIGLILMMRGARTR